jgi:methylated-DNA-[protein]-cysteine S-methyltransferase
MTKTLCHSYLKSPIGRIFLAGDGEFLMALYMENHKHWGGPTEAGRESDASFKEVRGQLEEYFAGERKVFDVPIKQAGTDFQLRVWQELAKIPFGVTISYGQLAGRIGNPAASRAVGLANGRNTISIIVPCHRVIGANGKLTGYGGGMERKEWLLKMEGVAG